MSDHQVIAILVGVLALLAGGLGYGLGEQRRHRDETETYVHQLEEHERRLRAHGALIEVIAEDYDPPNGREPTPEQRRAAFRVIKGDGASAIVLLFAGPITWLRKHGRSLTGALAAAGVTAIVAAGLLAHGGTPQRPSLGKPPSSPPGATVTADSATPHPSTRPSHTPHRVLPPPPILPTRRKPVSATPSGPVAGSPPTPRPSPSRSPALSPRAKPSPTNTCPVGVAVHLPGAGVTICV